MKEAYGRSVGLRTKMRLMEEEGGKRGGVGVASGFYNGGMLKKNFPYIFGRGGERGKRD